MKEASDVLLLLYDSSGNPEENEMACRFIEKAAKRFVELKINSVKFAAYDVYAYSMPLEMEYTKDLPQVLFFPANHKQPPFRYFQDIRTDVLMKNIQQSADIKFELPENYHLNSEELKRFNSGVPLEDL